MAYRLILKPSALRDQEALPAHILKRLDAHLGALAENPRPSGALKLKGGEALYRLRVGDYRVMYEIADTERVVRVARVRHRREVYRGR